MKIALDMLGLRAYHSTDLHVDKQENIEAWMRALDWKYNGIGKPFERQDWDKMMPEYATAIDAPACFFAAEMAEAYPEAKVVVLNRDPESWFFSCVKALGQRRRMGSWYHILFLWDPRIRCARRYMGKKQEDVWKFEWDEPGAREKAFAFFEDYYADCRARIPQERRLEFNVREGWGPLCEHLGVEVPTALGEDGKSVPVPFPRTNEAEEFRAKMTSFRYRLINEALKDWCRRLFIGAAAGYGLYAWTRPWVRHALRLLTGR